MKPIIEVRNLAKKYKIGERQRYLSLRDSVENLFSSKNTEGSASEKKTDFWALDDVSFDIQAGESVGIIGRNGAGKSTLLKILARITPPTKGNVILRGRMASLLEVGTGFHPELTGRENVYFNGSILGLKKAEIQAKFDEIVDFSGVEQFIDTPLKHYSSGMQLRLAFSVAAHLEPEILVIDEVLAVGDAEFQKKCLGKMDEVSKGGRTVLFVSHNLEQIKRLCTKSILLEKGRISSFDDSYNVINLYLKKNTKHRTEWQSEQEQPTVKTLDNPYFHIQKLTLTDEFGKILDSEIDISNKKIFVEITGYAAKKNNLLNIGFQVFDAHQMPIFMSYQTDGEEGEWTNIKEGLNKLRATLDISQLNEGTYRVEFVCGLHCVKMLYADDAISVNFNLTGLRGNSVYYTKRRNFTLSPLVKWENLSV